MGVTALWTNSHPWEITPYLGTIRAMHIDVVVNTRVNALSPADDITAYLDALDAAGLKAWFCVRELGKDVVYERVDKTLSVAELATLTAFINAYKAHPAVTGWYTDDEGEIGYPISTRQQVYDAIKAVDPTGLVVEAHYHLAAGAYSPDVHDLFVLDAYPYSYLSAGGCVDLGGQLVGSDAGKLDWYEAVLTAAKSDLDTAGEAHYMMVMQALGQDPDRGTMRTFAMPPAGGITRIWERTQAAGWDDYGAGWFLWLSNAASTMPLEIIHGIGEAQYGAQRAEVAEIAATISTAGTYPEMPPYPVPDVDAMRLPEYSVLVGPVGYEPDSDITDLVDMEALARSMSERGEASATIVIPVESENDVPSNYFARDAVVAIDVDGSREWLGHVVTAHKPRPEEPAWTLDCAGGWDVLHHDDTWCMGFVETRYEMFREMAPNTYPDPIAYKKLTASKDVSIDTDGQLLMLMPKGSVVKDGQGMWVALPILDDLDPDAQILGFTCDTYSNMAVCGAFIWLQTSAYNAEEMLMDPAGWGVGVDFRSGDAGWTGGPYRALCVAFFADIDGTLATDDFLQIRNLRIYVGRTTAPRVDEIVAAIDDDVRPTAPTPETEAIGSPLTSFMCDPFMLPSDGIGQALAKAAVPPLCGVFANQLVIKNRPSVPPDTTRLWTVSEAITPGLEWGVEIDEEQSKDYVGVSYAVLGVNAITESEPVGTTWPTTWYRSNATNCTAAASYFRVRSNATEYNSYIRHDGTVPVVPGQVMRLRMAAYLSGYVNGQANVGIQWRDSAGTYISDSALWTKAAADATEHWIDVTAVAPAGAAFARALLWWTGRSASGDTSIYARYVDIRPAIQDGTPQISYYPSAPPNSAARTGLIDGGDLTAVEAYSAAQQAYAYLHEFASGPVTIPYRVLDGNGNERPADLIRSWDWVVNVGSLDLRTAGPFLISEVAHQGGIATVSVGASDAYQYNGPERLPTKGKYIGAHQGRQRFKRWSKAKKRPAGRGWHRKGKRWWRWAYKRVDVPSRYA